MSVALYTELILARARIAELEAERDALRAALTKAVEAMEDDWHQIDGEWGPIMGRFGDLEGAIAAGKADHIKNARAAIAAKEPK